MADPPLGSRGPLQSLVLLIAKFYCSLVTRQMPITRNVEEHHTPRSNYNAYYNPSVCTVCMPYMMQKHQHPYSYCTVLSLAIVSVPPSTIISSSYNAFVFVSSAGHSITPTLKVMVVSSVKGEGTSK